MTRPSGDPPAPDDPDRPTEDVAAHPPPLERVDPPRDADDETRAAPAMPPDAPEPPPSDEDATAPDAPGHPESDAPATTPHAPSHPGSDAPALAPDAPEPPAPARDDGVAGRAGRDDDASTERLGPRAPRERAEVRAPRALAAVLVALLVALATADAIAVVSDLWAHPTFRQAATGATPFLDADDVHEWQSALGIAQVALTVAVAAAWLAWFRRAYATSGALHGGTRRALSWAVWAWVVPIVNLFRPKAMTDEAFSNSGDGVPAHVHWWWGVTLASVALSVAALVATPSSPTAGALADATLFHAVADLAGAAAALLGVAVVSSLTARQVRAARPGP